MAIQPGTPWYSDGLRFQCTACGDCCSGDPGYVWVGPGEIEALAGLLRESVDNFEKRCVRRVGDRKSLRERRNGDCILFDSETRRCGVYPARPAQCRTWPFWDSNLDSPKTWARTCEACPGSGEGRLYHLAEIEEQLAVKERC